MMTWPGPVAAQPTLTDGQLEQVKSVVQEVVSETMTRVKHTQSDRFKHVVGRDRSVSPNCDPDTDKSRRKPRGKYDAPLETDNVDNLSGYRLSPPASSLLRKGLSFVPSPQLDGPHFNANLYIKI